MLSSNTAKRENTVTEPEDTRPKVKIVGSKDTLNDWIWGKTQGVVQSGPFTGMQLVKEESWSDGNLGNKCLGCYEMELHDLVNAEVKNFDGADNPKILNIGCAEGYYAVGMARLLPKATIWAIDSNPEALRITQDAARINDVKVITGSDATAFINEADLIISDCEGYETTCLDLDLVPALAKTRIIVECHDYRDQRTTQILADRFANTHNVMFCISETVRMPNSFEFMCQLPSHAKWMAVSEGRPSTQYFLYMIPK